MTLIPLIYKSFIKQCATYPHIRNSLRKGILTIDDLDNSYPLYQREYGMKGFYGRVITCSPYTNPLLSAISTLKYVIQNKNSNKYLGWNIYSENDLKSKNIKYYTIAGEVVDIDFLNNDVYDVDYDIDYDIDYDKDYDIIEFEKNKDKKLIYDFIPLHQHDKIF